MQTNPAMSIADATGLSSRDPIAVTHVQDVANKPKPIATVLIVDDESKERESLKNFLGYENYRFLEANCGRDGIELVQREEIDLVLLDVQMPDLDGLSTCRILRQLQDCHALPIVMLTPTDGGPTASKVFDYGANDYVAKPIDRAVLRTRVTAQLTIKQTQKALRNSEERYALVSRGTNDGIWDWNLITGDLYLSARWRAMVGMEDPSWNPRGSDWIELVYHEDRKRVLSDLQAHLYGKASHFETELRMQDRNHNFRWMLCRGLAVKDESGLACRIAGSLTDITEGKVADPLTGLPNRTLFQDRVNRCIEQMAGKKDQTFAVIYADVDDFKMINDQFGHEAGDAFLINVTQRFEAALRESDAVIARLGGDEFGILLESVRNEEDAIKIACRVHETLDQPIEVAEREIQTRASMGIVLANYGAEGFIDNTITADKLLAYADTAMYLAKSQRDCPYCVFKSKMIADSTVRLEMASELKHAIAREELSLNYQPIIDLRTSTTLGYEALVRWHHPIHGNVPPNVFIPIAEAKGLIVEIGELVLKKACHQATLWRNQVGRDVVISVNVSMRQLASKRFVSAVIDTLRESQLPPHCLKLEVTESLLMQQPTESLSKLHELRREGVMIAIDDFGTGYSSLSYLHQMPLDVLKVDRSFVNGMFDSGKHLAIIRAILALAASLQLKVIAEGVETIEQLQQLHVLGCEMVQGYYFSKPLPVAEAGELLNRVWEWPKAEVCSLIFTQGPSGQLLTQRPVG